jgi:hypothetical protein
MLDDNVRAIPIDLGGGSIMLVEATILPNAADRRPQDISNFVPTAQQFGDVIELLKKLSVSLPEAIKAAEPTKACLEFAIDVGVSAGHLTALLVKGEAKGNLKVSLEWSKLS